tara:strand:+ start:84 stop:452 length:369 start_codon:yes stop_codon:yes gene_type:complete
MKTSPWNHYIQDKSLTKEEVRLEIDRIHGLGGAAQPFSSDPDQRSNSIALCVDGPLEGVAVSLLRQVQEFIMPIDGKMKLVQYEYSDVEKAGGLNGQWSLRDIIDMDTMTLDEDYKPPERFE